MWLHGILGSRKNWRCGQGGRYGPPVDEGLVHLTRAWPWLRRTPARKMITDFPHFQAVVVDHRVRSWSGSRSGKQQQQGESGAGLLLPRGRGMARVRRDRGRTHSSRARWTCTICCSTSCRWAARTSARATRLAARWRSLTPRPASTTVRGEEAGQEAGGVAQGAGSDSATLIRSFLIHHVPGWEPPRHTWVFDSLPGRVDKHRAIGEHSVAEVGAAGHGHGSGSGQG